MGARMLTLDRRDGAAAAAAAAAAVLVVPGLVLQGEPRDAGRRHASDSFLFDGVIRVAGVNVGVAAFGVDVWLRLPLPLVLIWALPSGATLVVPGGVSEISVSATTSTSVAGAGDRE
jgi:hypothetical protein